jgi:hypothetical protein
VKLNKLYLKLDKTDVLLIKLNLKIIGWARYYSTAVSYKTFQWLDTLLFKALFEW